MKIRVFACLLMLALICSLGGCGYKPAAITFDENHKKNFLESFTAAENSNFLLKWDAERKRILLEDIKNAKIYSTLPEKLMEQRVDSEGDEIINPPQLENPLIVEYFNSENRKVELLYGYTGALQKGSYEISKIKNGFKIIYHFDSKKISVPVEYTLLEKGLNVSVDTDEIREAESRIYRISIMPFFCSAENSAGGDYLFVPSGSGALISPGEKLSDASFMVSYPVYGTDLLLENTITGDFNKSEPVRLPVYGAKSGDSAVCSIITEGAEKAFIECNVGNIKYGYSSVYSSFEIRGVSHKGSYSEEMGSGKISVDFLPLTGEKASYVGMAETYRDYLYENGLKEKNEDKLFSLKIIGATNVDAQILGVPYSKLFATTTVKQAEKIIKDIESKTGTAPIVNLVGFGKSGLDIGKVAGDYKLSAKLGGKNDLEALKDTAAALKTDIYFDYDIVNFSKTGGGIKKLSDYARTTVGQRAMRYTIDLGSGGSNMQKQYFVTREKLVSVGKNAVDSFVSGELGGISFNTASATAYSDYRNRKYYAKSGYSNDFKEISDYLKAEKLKLLADNANEYAAVAADIITSAPSYSDENDLFTTDVPFYQIVFKGSVPIICDSLNLADSADNQLLKAAEGGMGLQYTVINNYDKSLITAEQDVFAFCNYDSIAERLSVTVKSYGDYFGAIKNAKIISHEIINEDIRNTVFSNGTVVFVNYGTAEYETDIGTVKPNSFIYKKGSVE